MKGLVQAHAATARSEPTYQTRANDYRPVFARAVTFPGIPGIIPGTGTGAPIKKRPLLRNAGTGNPNITPRGTPFDYQRTPRSE
jgi:hypothetical protein